jgi:predicted metal-dependent RNase
MNIVDDLSNSNLLTIDNISILLDCGMNEQTFSSLIDNYLAYLKLSCLSFRAIGKIHVILLSHPILSYIGMLPILAKKIDLSKA